MLACEAQIALSQAEQPFGRDGARKKALVAVLLVEFQGSLDQGAIDTLLAAEVRVDRANRDVGLLGQFLHRRR